MTIPKNPLHDARMARMEAARTPNPVTRPYGIPVDKDEFAAFIAKGGFTPQQVFTLKQMVDMETKAREAAKAAGTLTPKGEAESLAWCEMISNAIAGLSDKFNPFNP